MTPSSDANAAIASAYSAIAAKRASRNGAPSRRTRSIASAPMVNQWTGSSVGPCRKKSMPRPSAAGFRDCPAGGRAGACRRYHHGAFVAPDGEEAA